MIINSVRAENVLKYSVLEIPDIPEKGLIAVSGDNESGKSSIGESICFALFGRTFSLDSKDLDKVIRWGESRCSIKLDFTTADGQRYQVSRFLDELGNHGASISRAGEEPMVRGVDEVEASIKGIIGIGYTEFIESFYLAQREITTPHPHSFAVKAMAGVDALEKTVANCQDEVTRATQQSVDTEKQHGDIEEQIAALNLQEGHLESLEKESEGAASSLETDRAKISELKAASDNSEGMVDILKSRANSLLALAPEASFNERQAQTENLSRVLADLQPQCRDNNCTGAAYAKLSTFARELGGRLTAFDPLRQKAAAYRRRLGRSLGEPEPGHGDGEESTFSARHEELRQAEAERISLRRVSRGLMIFFGALAVVLWGGWGLLSLMPNSMAAKTLDVWLSGLSQDWETLYQPWIVVVGTVATLLFVVFLGRVISLNRQLGECTSAVEQLNIDEQVTRQESQQLGQLDNMPLPQAATLLTNLREEQLASTASIFLGGPGSALIDAEQHAADKEVLKQTLAQLVAGLSRIKADAAQEIESLHESVTAHASQIARLDEVIHQERERVRRYGELVGIAQSLRIKIDETGHRIRVRDLAIDLLKGAIHYISQRFNTEVRNLAADSLPRLTNGRYEHLQIDENLRVKAFSNEKRDFMDLDEISSGTQRQIMLAVRLALSQKLVNSVIQGPQMLFLDEPFAFFDERRTAGSLAVLPQVSGNFTQIWVTSQTFPAKSHFDVYVECNAEETRSPAVHSGSGKT